MMVDVPRAALRVFANAHSRRRGGASTNYYSTLARERPFKQSGHWANHEMLRSTVMQPFS
jgi:hypothetical protein